MEYNVLKIDIDLTGNELLSYLSNTDKTNFTPNDLIDILKQNQSKFFENVCH